MHNFKDLVVWKDAMILAKEIHTLTRKFPVEEKYIITSQIMRSAILIPSNISEGAGRNSKKEFFHFLNIALGSSFELETQIILANDFGYVPDEKREFILDRLIRIQKMINNLQKSLKSDT
jgi:four helix bundle protein